MRCKKVEFVLIIRNVNQLPSDWVTDFVLTCYMENSFPPISSAHFGAFDISVIFIVCIQNSTIFLINFCHGFLGLFRASFQDGTRPRNVVLLCQTATFFLTFPRVLPSAIWDKNCWGGAKCNPVHHKNSRKHKEPDFFGVSSVPTLRWCEWKVRIVVCLNVNVVINRPVQVIVVWEISGPHDISGLIEIRSSTDC